MYFEKVSIHLQGDLSFPLPPLHRVLQEFDHSHLSAPEIEASTRDALSFLKTETCQEKPSESPREAEKYKILNIFSRLRFVF